jgi:hypothetical protein
MWVSKGLFYHRHFVSSAHGPYSSHDAMPISKYSIISKLGHFPEAMPTSCVPHPFWSSFFVIDASSFYVVLDGRYDCIGWQP